MLTSSFMEFTESQLGKVLNIKKYTQSLHEGGGAVKQKISYPKIQPKIPLLDISRSEYNFDTVCDHGL